MGDSGTVRVVTSPDLAIGAFTDEGPWIVDPHAMTWRRGLDQERIRTRAEVRGLLSPGRLPPLGRLSRVTAEISTALAGWAVVSRGRPGSRTDLARRFRIAFERLGSTYVKLGQIVSGGEGLFPPDIVSEFAMLRDKVPPEPFPLIRQVVERELGDRLDRVFVDFAEEPIAAASIAQVHAARLVTGEEVVVKVQRPRVADLVRADIAAMTWIAPRLVGRIPVSALANPPALVELFAETIVEELDFRLEAENMLDIAEVLADEGQRGLVVPRPHPTLVTRRVLVMEQLRGFAFDDVESMHAAGIDTDAVLRSGLIGFLEGAMIHGIFHGDLHGGNLMVMSDGRTAVFDYGITGRLDERERLAVLGMLVTGLAGDVRGQLASLRDLGAFPPDVDIEAVVRDLELDQPVKDPTLMSADELVTELRELVKKLLGYGAAAPKVLMLMLKNLMFLNSATATLAPDLDLLAEVASIYTYFTETHGARILAELGMEEQDARLDIDAVKAGFGLSSDTERLTFRELQDRRQTIIERMGDRTRKEGA